MTNGPTHTYSVPAMSCDHCVAAITDYLRQVRGVEKVDVDLETKIVTVVGGDDQTIVSAIDQAGYDIN